MFHYSHSEFAGFARKEPVQARSRETVAAILEAAAHVFARRGASGFTTNHVAVRAGVSIGSVYQYFPDKDALLAALVERDMRSAHDAMLAALRRLRERELAPLPWSRALLRAWCSTHEDAHQHALYAISAALPGVRERAHAGMHSLGTEIARQLGRRGVRRPALRAQVLLLMALGLVHELIIALPHGARRKRAEGESAAALAAYIRSALPASRR